MPRTEPLPERLRGRKNVVVVGGGVAALEAMLALRALAGERLAIQLVAPERHFFYRPLAVAEPFGLGAVPRFPLDELARDAASEYVPGAVAEVDPDERVVVVEHGPELRYDALLVASGTRAEEAVGGALTFRGPADTERFAETLREAAAGAADRLVFAIPSGATWHLPLYELALQSEEWLRERAASPVSITIVTPEDRPLEAFGPDPSDAVARLLEERGIVLRTGEHPAAFADGLLTVFPRASIAASRVIALPRLHGNAPAGIPADPRGFVPVDGHCRVRSFVDVYAAGDVTTIPVKQGGLAAQQADAAAESIAADFDLAVRGASFRPVLRGLLLTGGRPRYLRRDVGAATSAVDLDPLWWPPAKVVGRHLAPYLARRAGVSLEAPARGDVIPIEIAVGGG